MIPFLAILGLPIIIHEILGYCFIADDAVREYINFSIINGQ